MVIAVSTCLVGFSAWSYDTMTLEETTNSTVKSPTAATAVAYYDSIYFASVEAAVNSANNAGGSKTVYVIPGTNPTISESFVVNSGITLILPYEGTTYKNSTIESGQGPNVSWPDSTNMMLKVTLSSNVNIVVNGNLYVGGVVGAGNGGQQNAGHTCGKFAQITMENNSSITFNNGSSLFCNGYIIENTNHQGDYSENTNTTIWPHLIFNSGSKLTTPFVIHDYRGGTEMLSMSGETMYFNEYEIRNIRTLTTLNYGSEWFVNTYFYMRGIRKAENIKLIGNSSSYFIQMSNQSHIDFKYNFSSSTFASRYQNFMDIRLYGSFTINSMTIDAGYTVDTSSMRLNLNYSFHLYFYDGTSTCRYKTKMMAGSKLFVGNNATVNFANLAVYSGYVDGTTSGHGTPYPSDSQAGEASLINNGTFVSATFGGKVVSSNPGATTTVSTNQVQTTEYTSSGTKTIKHTFKLKMLKNGYIEQTFSEVSAGNYFSYTDSLSNTGWFTDSGIISYNTMGSSDSFADKNITFDTAGYSFTSQDLQNTPSRDHYTFGGWYLDPNYSENSKATVGTTIFSGTTLYAKWLPIEYDVIYHFDKWSNGDSTDGSETNDNRNIAHYTIETVSSLYPALFGNNLFDGWYLNSNYTGKISSINSSVFDVISSPYTLNLYGRWYSSDTQTYTITYSNSNSDEGCTCISSETIIADNLSTYAPPSLDGLNNNIQYNKYFDGWYLDGEFNTKYTSSSQIDGNKTLYAKWLNKNEVNVAAVLGGETTILATYYIANGVYFTIPNISDKVPNLEPKTGYEFKWRIVGGDLDGNILSAGENVCLSSSWGESITVICDEYPLDCSLKLTVGNYISCTLKVNGEVRISNLKNGNQTITVKTGDEITLELSRDSGYSEGGGVSFNDGITEQNGKYIVNGTMLSPTINIASASEPSCLLPDTLITLEDGTQVEVKDLQPGDVIRVFNHETGRIETSPVIFNDHDEKEWLNVIHLEFSNDKEIGVVSEHGFFDIDTMQYEYIRESNYSHFIGHKFYTENGEIVTLVNAYVSLEYTEVYSPVTYYHLNYFTEGILSMPGGATGFFNIFEYGEDLKYDEEAYNRDIELYGLCTYEELAEYGVTEIMFEAYAGKYIYIALGKGVLTEEQLSYLIEKYGVLAEEQEP